VLTNFIALQNTSLSPEFEPENLRYNGKHDNHHNIENDYLVSNIFKLLVNILITLSFSLQNVVVLYILHRISGMGCLRFCLPTMPKGIIAFYSWGSDITVSVSAYWNNGNKCISGLGFCN
jgi:hypothetical protein